MILWIWLVLIIAILIWVERNSGHSKVTPHHDSMDYSYYTAPFLKDLKIWAMTFIVQPLPNIL